MKIVDEKTLELEDGEPAFRSCWECNGAHEHLKKVNTLHHCFSCGRYWIFDKFLDTFEDHEDIIKWLNKEIGVEIGKGTTTVDGGYRVSVMTINLDNKTE